MLPPIHLVLVCLINCTDKNTLTERAFPNLQDWRIKHLALKLPPDVVGKQRSIEDETDPVATQQ